MRQNQNDALTPSTRSTEAGSTEAGSTNAGPTNGGSTNGASWAGFLAAAFCVVGLLGIFATYAAPLPYQRIMLRDQTLDQLATSPITEPAALRARFADPLGDSADAVLNGPAATRPARIQAERVAMHARLQAEATATAGRLRVLIALVTVLGAGFGATMLGLHRRG